MEPVTRKRSGLNRNDKRKAKALAKASHSDGAPQHSPALENLPACMPPYLAPKLANPPRRPHSTERDVS
jgi:hypothetical protein